MDVQTEPDTEEKEEKKQTLNLQAGYRLSLGHSLGDYCCGAFFLTENNSDDISMF